MLDTYALYVLANHAAALVNACVNRSIEIIAQNPRQELLTKHGCRQELLRGTVAARARDWSSCQVPGVVSEIRSLQ